MAADTAAPEKLAEAGAGQRFLAKDPRPMIPGQGRGPNSSPSFRADQIPCRAFQRAPTIFAEILKAAGAPLKSRQICFARVKKLGEDFDAP